MISFFGLLGGLLGFMIPFGLGFMIPIALFGWLAEVIRAMR